MLTLSVEERRRIREEQKRKQGYTASIDATKNAETGENGSKGTPSKGGKNSNAPEKEKRKSSSQRSSQLPPPSKKPKFSLTLWVLRPRLEEKWLKPAFKLMSVQLKMPLGERFWKWRRTEIAQRVAPWRLLGMFAIPLQRRWTRFLFLVMWKCAENGTSAKSIGDQDL